MTYSESLTAGMGELCMVKEDSGNSGVEPTDVSLFCYNICTRYKSFSSLATPLTTILQHRGARKE